ncbi:MAG: dihydrolipoyl dehydrogenase [Anaerolineae bacterium]
MAEQQYDVVILGSGPGGYIAAIRAGQLGLRVACVEQGDIGGVCTNWGCIPTKALLRNAEVLELVRHAEQFGVEAKDIQVSWPVGVKRAERVVRQSRQGIEFLFKKNKVEVVKGRGSLVDANTMRVEGADGTRELKARNFIIATGARPFVPKGVTVDGKTIITSKEAVALPEPPKRLLIMGAGAIGCEFSTVYSAYGTQCVIFEMMGQVLPLEDAESGATLQKALQKRGVEINLNTRVDGAEARGDGVVVKVTTNDQTREVEGDLLLMAAGNVGNTENMGFEALGIEIGRGNVIGVNEYLQTAVPNIYAIGDVVKGPRLAHKAMHEGVIAVEHIAGLNPSPMHWDNIPSCTYSHPEVASIGMSEAKARETVADVKVSKFPFSASGRARALGDTEGYVKVVADAKYGEILGVHMVGPEVTEMIHELAVARTNEMTVEEIIHTIHAHPTLSETIHEASLGIVGAPLHI